MNNGAPGHLYDRPPSQALGLSTPSYEPHGPVIRQVDQRSNIDVGLPILSRICITMKQKCSLMDLRMTTRFVVVCFSYFLGFATMYSVFLATGQSDEELPSPRSTTYPIIVAQVSGSLLSPLIFGVVSIRDNSTSLRQKIVSLYYLLLTLGVLMSVVSLLLCSLWPAGYRVNNMVMIASLMFTTLGGWQSLEKDWKDASDPHAARDIELNTN